MHGYDETRILLCFEAIAAIEPSAEAKLRVTARVRKAITGESVRSVRLPKMSISKIVAAVVIASVGLGIIYLSGRYEGIGSFVRQTDKEDIGISGGGSRKGLAGAKEREREKNEFGRIEVMVAADDVKGLIAMLGEGTWKSKVVAANYLAKIGDESAFEALEKLSREWGINEPNNPFAAAIMEIKQRREQEKQPQEPCSVGMEKKGTESGQTDGLIDHNGVLDIYVIDKNTMKPLADAKIRINLNYDQQTDVHTDKNGWYGVELPKGGTDYIRVVAGKSGFVPASSQWSKTIPEIHTFVLERGVSVGGIVQNEAGEPIADVNVCLIIAGDAVGTWNSLSEISSVRTDNNGRWQSDMVPANADMILIRLEHSEYISDENYNVRPCPPIKELRAMTDILVMQKGVEVTGQVLDTEGRTVVDAVVGTGTDRRNQFYPKQLTDSWGKFRLGNLRPGKVVFTFKGGKGYSPELREIEVAEGMEPIEVRLWPAYKLHGKVVDSGNKPLTNVLFTTQDWQGYRTLAYGFKTGEDGRFEWRSAPREEVKYDITKNGYVGITGYKMTALEGEQIIILSKCRKVIGSVVDTETGEPIKQFNVRVGSYFNEVQSGNLVWQLKENLFKDGRFETELSENGVGWAVKIEADGYEAAISDVNDSGEGEAMLNFKLRKGKIIRGTVYLPNGEPASGAEIIVYGLQENVRVANNKWSPYSGGRMIKTDLQGQYVFTPPSGEYTVLVIHNNGCTKVSGEDLKEVSDIPLEEWGRVEGRLLLGGKAGGYERVCLYYINDTRENRSNVSRYYNETTDANGNFVFDKVIAGNIRVQNWVQNGSHNTVRIGRNIQLNAGERVRVVLDSGEGMSVVGRLAVPAGVNEPFDWRNSSINVISNCPGMPKPENYERMTEEQRREWYAAWEKTEEGKKFIQESQKEFRFYNAVVEKDGTFRVEGIEEGEYILQARLLDTLSGNGKIIGGADYRFAVETATDGDPKPLDVGTIQMEFWK